MRGEHSPRAGASYQCLERCGCFWANTSLETGLYTSVDTQTHRRIGVCGEIGSSTASAREGWKSHEPFRAAWVGDTGWLSLESDFSKGSFVDPAVVSPSCKEAASPTPPARRDLGRCGASGEAGPDVDRSGANHTDLDPGNRPGPACGSAWGGLSSSRRCWWWDSMGGFGLMSSPRALLLAGWGETV